MEHGWERISLGPNGTMLRNGTPPPSPFFFPVCRLGEVCEHEEQELPGDLLILFFLFFPPSSNQIEDGAAREARGGSHLPFPSSLFFSLSYIFARMNGSLAVEMPSVDLVEIASSPFAHFFSFFLSFPSFFPSTVTE